MAPNVGLEAKVDDRTESDLFSRQQTDPLLEPLSRRNVNDTARTQVLDVVQRDLTHQSLESAPTVVSDEQQPLVSQSQPLSLNGCPLLRLEETPCGRLCMVDQLHQRRTDNVPCLRICNRNITFRSSITSKQHK